MGYITARNVMSKRAWTARRPFAERNRAPVVDITDVTPRITHSHTASETDDDVAWISKALRKRSGSPLSGNDTCRGRKLITSPEALQHIAGPAWDPGFAKTRIGTSKHAGLNPPRDALARMKKQICRKSCDALLHLVLLALGRRPRAYSLG